MEAATPVMGDDVSKHAPCNAALAVSVVQTLAQDTTALPTHAPQ